MANETETKRWNDDAWTAAWPRREKLTDAVTPYVLVAAGAGPGERVCDVGCGGGRLALALAGAVGPEGEVVGVDISAPLLELARSRAREAAVANARFVELDVQTGSLAEAPFDLAVSQFGVMFFDEPLAALRAIRGYLAPGGRLVFACWQDVERNPWHVRTVLRSLLPPAPTPRTGKSPVGPFAFGDDEYVHDLLGSAGFAAVDSTDHDTIVRGPASAVFDPSSFQLFGIPAEREVEAQAAIDHLLEQFAVGPDEYDFPLAFRVFRALNP